MNPQRRWTYLFGTMVVMVLLLGLLLEWAVSVRTAALALLCVSAWVTGVVPLWAPTLVLWAATPILLAGPLHLGVLDPIRWSLNPVLALFTGGLMLGLAAQIHGVDRRIAALAHRISGGRTVPLHFVAGAGTTFLSMWMSNIAAGALMFAALRPLWRSGPSPLQRSLPIVIAMGANFGGIATPVGTGPNGIAMAAVARQQPIDFLDWMYFGTPLALGLTVAAVMLVLVLVRPANLSLPPPAETDETRFPWGLALIFGGTILLWLTEAIHGISAWIISLAAVGLLLGSGIVRWRDLHRLEWGTLVLIAGGITLGVLLERSGVVATVAAVLPQGGTTPGLTLFLLCLFCATLSALMSNTATATFLIPLAASISPLPSTAIIVAVAASLGVPFVISTPPNALAVAAGARPKDLLLPGLILMVGGSLLVAVTGPPALRLAGIP